MMITIGLIVIGAVYLVSFIKGIANRLMMIGVLVIIVSVLSRLIFNQVIITLFYDGNKDLSSLFSMLGLVILFFGIIINKFVPKKLKKRKALKPCSAYVYPPIIKTKVWNQDNM